jgi:hypothetical protein
MQDPKLNNVFSFYFSINFTANRAYFPDTIYTSIRSTGSIHVQTLIKQNTKIYYVPDIKQITQSFNIRFQTLNRYCIVC